MKIPLLKEKKGKADNDYKTPLLEGSCIWFISR